MAFVADWDGPRHKVAEAAYACMQKNDQESEPIIQEPVPGSVRVIVPPTEDKEREVQMHFQLLDLISWPIALFFGKVRKLSHDLCWKSENSDQLLTSLCGMRAG